MIRIICTTQVDIKSNSGASFIWTLNGAGSSIGRRRIRLQQAPGSTTLVANTVPGGNTNCGTLPSGVWSRVTLIVHTAPRTFDVLIDGASTCTGAAGIQPPFNSVSVMDASNDGWAAPSAQRMSLRFLDILGPSFLAGESPPFCILRL